jgi:nucleoid-associated protein YgaU
MRAFDPRHIFDWSIPAVKSREFELTKSVWDYRRGGRSVKSEFESGDQASAYRSVVWHKIRKGETLSSIARRYGTSVSNLAKMNKLSVRSTLRVGQRLRVK